MALDREFLTLLTGSFAQPAAENPTVAVMEAAYRLRRRALPGLGEDLLGALVGEAQCECEFPHGHPRAVARADDGADLVGRLVAQPVGLFAQLAGAFAPLCQFVREHDVEVDGDRRWADVEPGGDQVSDHLLGVSEAASLRDDVKFGNGEQPELALPRRAGPIRRHVNHPLGRHPSIFSTFATTPDEIVPCRGTGVW